MMNECAFQGQVEFVASKVSTETASEDVERVPVDGRVRVEKGPVEDDGFRSRRRVDVELLRRACSGA